MTGPNRTTSAVAGTPQDFSSGNVFDWLFSNPFQSVNAYTPEAQRVPSIRGSHRVFVDHVSDRALTYSTLRNDALALGAGLRGLGLRPDDVWTLPPTPTCPRPEIAPVVLIQLPNSLQFATSLLGTWAAGFTATLVSPSLTASEISWVLQNARPHAVITASSCLGPMQEALRLQEDKQYFTAVPVFTVDVANENYPSPVDKLSSLDWRNLLASAPAQASSGPKFDSRSRTAVILWSSGTSGKPKGVLLSHHALNFSVASLWHDADYYQGQNQHWLGYVPFYHVFGLTNAFMLAICTGSTVYTMTGFKLDAVLAAVPKRGITYFHMAPPVAVMLAKSPVVEPYARRDKTGKNAFSKIVGGVTGGAPLGHEVVVEVYKRLGFRVRLGYGLTEACSVSLQRGLGETEMMAQHEDTGKPHWGVELMVSDGSQAVSGQPSQPAAAEQSGEIFIRSPSLMTGYLPFHGAVINGSPDMSITTESLTHDGWFRTGDVGTLSNDGRLTITDRIKELIKVRAFQVAPAELEAVLCSSKEVADAGVIAVYDKNQATEWPRAYVVASNPSEDGEQMRALAGRLKKLVEEKTAKFKWLIGGIVFVNQIPKSPSGKILRRVLKSGDVKGLEIELYTPRKRTKEKL